LGLPYPLDDDGNATENRLSNPTPATLLPVGGFYKDTDGQQRIEIEHGADEKMA
jgi:hypothetical protein